ncbi:MAG: FliM/FliN family flagellar motor switch protein [Deltaproteobacteria bacterium]|nr:FliM/FliN family flagellar motor switch protein [Deltaproteobacteria bacterium]
MTTDTAKSTIHIKNAADSALLRSLWDDDALWRSDVVELWPGLELTESGTPSVTGRSDDDARTVSNTHRAPHPTNAREHSYQRLQATEPLSTRGQTSGVSSTPDSTHRTAYSADATAYGNESVLSCEAALPTNSRLLSEIPVEMTVELGEVLISAEELLTLLPGTTIDIRLEENEPLILRVGGERIGTGRLRKKGEGLALEILSFEDADDPAENVRESGNMNGNVDRDVRAGTPSRETVHGKGR